ncbi:hypothetical protein [Amycolatopsis nigrescens]|uniref:hypothetical protein n=1 Tax=Amycolatopsis nigrescens TaxID=381445 RepID=UPI0003A5CCF5|nr:hypothetical protein [Amycolatopsis nigrescens]
MEENTCPRCGWPLRKLVWAEGSAHPVSTGHVSYRRCVCGAWVLRFDDEPIAATAHDEPAERPPPV